MADETREMDETVTDDATVEAAEATDTPAESKLATDDTPSTADAAVAAADEKSDVKQDTRPPRPKREPVALEDKVVRGETAAERLLTLLGVKAEGITGRVDGEQVVLEVAKIEAPTALDNRAYEALQFMLNKAINRGAARRTRLSLQTDGFRGRRADGLGRVAVHLSHKARRLGITLSVGPLGANDLRALTSQLNRQKGLKLESTGDGEQRRIVISANEPNEAGEGGTGRRRRRRKRRRNG
ncbi:MAG: hypothetical protein KC502_05500 [Myxococcales bacterium]|nr:hypothetical protein [Myxococcales bacterium]